MKRALLRCGVVVWAVGAAAIGVAPQVAQADAPAQQGWWSTANPGGLPANPTDAVVDVPKGGLLIQAGPVDPTAPDCKCTAFAGLIYELGQDMATELTLKVAPNTATTPVATLELCAITDASLDIESGGPMTDAPAFDCKKHAMASLDAGGKSFKFTVGSLITDGTLAVAIIPGDSTSRVVLEKPDESSLATTPSLASGDDSYTSGTPTTPDDTSTSTTSSDTAPPPAADPQPVSNPGAPSVTTTGGATDDRTPVVAPSPSASSSATNIAAQPVAAESDTGGSGIAVLLLLAGLGLGAVLWAMAGRAPLDTVTDA
jgi:hypothetical protein